MYYIFKHVIDNGFTTVISCGGIQSNHARAVAAVSAKLGIECHLILRIPKGENIEQSGNLLLNDILGAKVHFYKVEDYQDVRLCEELRVKLEKEDAGKKAYVIPSGGSNGIGLYGYQNAMLEIHEQNQGENIKSIVVACGSGGTVLGLAVENWKSKLGYKIFAVIIAGTESEMSAEFDRMIFEREQFDANGLKGFDHNKEIVIISGYDGLGYGLSTKVELDLIKKFARKTGLVLDPVYTGKGFYGLHQELTKNEDQFPGDICFIHTGGIYGVLSGKFNFGQF